MCAFVRVTEDVDPPLTDIGAVAQHSEWPSINISIKRWMERVRLLLQKQTGLGHVTDLTASISSSPKRG